MEAWIWLHYDNPVSNCNSRIQAGFLKMLFFSNLFVKESVFKGFYESSVKWMKKEKQNKYFKTI